MFNVHSSARLAQRENKKALKVLNYLKTSPTDVSVYIPDQLADGAFIYKAFVFTPAGTFKFDTGGGSWIRKPSAKRAVSSGYKTIELDALLRNWRGYEDTLGRGREAEGFLVQ